MKTNGKEDHTCITTTLEIATNPVQRKCPNTYGALKTRESQI